MSALFLLLQLLLCVTSLKVCLEGQNDKGFVCFGLTTEIEVNGNVCIRLVTPSKVPCLLCNICPCTGFEITTSLYTDDNWYLTHLHNWLGIYPNNATQGYPYQCSIFPCCGKTCSVYVPFSYIYGNYSINICAIEASLFRL